MDDNEMKQTIKLWKTDKVKDFISIKISIDVYE